MRLSRLRKNSPKRPGCGWADSTATANLTTVRFLVIWSTFLFGFSNFQRLANGCTNVDFCVQGRIFQRFSKSTRLPRLCTARSSKSSQIFVKRFHTFVEISAKIAIFQQFSSNFAPISMKNFQNFDESFRRCWQILKFLNFWWILTNFHGFWQKFDFILICKDTNDTAGRSCQNLRNPAPYRRPSKARPGRGRARSRRRAPPSPGPEEPFSTSATTHQPFRGSFSALSKPILHPNTSTLFFFWNINLFFSRSKTWFS